MIFSTRDKARLNILYPPKSLNYPHLNSQISELCDIIALGFTREVDSLLYFAVTYTIKIIELFILHRNVRNYNKWVYEQISAITSEVQVIKRGR